MGGLKQGVPTTFGFLCISGRKVRISEISLYMHRSREVLERTQFLGINRQGQIGVSDMTPHVAGSGRGVPGST